jgi:hypothetical protein
VAGEGITTVKYRAADVVGNAEDVRSALVRIDDTAPVTTSDSMAGSGRNGVSVATVTLRAKTLPYWLCQDSGTVALGSGPVPSSMAFGCAGIAIGVILSFSASAGAARAQASATTTAIGQIERTTPEIVIFRPMASPCLRALAPSTRRCR